MLDNLNICQICLRTDKNLKRLDSKLSEFHDELCEYSLVCSVFSQYCKECEHQLRKAYNFREKCCKANKILKSWRKSKASMELLYTQLPPTTLGIWDESKASIFRYIHEDKPDSMLTNHKDVNNSTLKKSINLQIKPADKLVVGEIIPKEETEDLMQSYVGQNEFIDSHDRLIYDIEIKTKDDIDDSKTNININNTEHDVYINSFNKSKEKSVLDDLEENLGELNPDRVFNDLEVSTNADEIPDGRSINDADDCDLEDAKDAISTNNVYNRSKNVKNTKDRDCILDEKQNTSKQKSFLETVNTISMLDTGSVHDESKNEKGKHNYKNVKKVDQGKVKKRLNKIVNISEKNDTTKHRMYSKEWLKANLISILTSYGDLKTEDGTVIDKECILHIIGEEEPSKEFRELWDELNGTTTLSTKAVSLLNMIQNKDNEYKTVFQIKYLNTEEQVLEEFDKRRSYDAYLDAKFKCDLCHQWFEHKKRIENHMKCHDVRAGDFVCPICKSRLKHKNRLLQHMGVHKTVYKCKLCPLVTNYRHSMVNHYRQHQGVQYRCEHCNLVYKTQSSFNNHLAKSCKQRQRCVCTVCARTFVNKNGLSIHIHRKHRDEPPIDNATDVSCEHCDLTFPSQHVYERHLTISHEQNIHILRGKKRKPAAIRNPAVFTCRVCNAKGKSNGWLNLHFDLEHPTFDKSVLYADKSKHLCDICGKGYSSVYALREHANVHTGERPFACDQCPARFGVANNLSNHKLTHAPPKLSCVRCGKKFRSPGNLYSHMRTHIGDRRFKCSICGKGFLHRWSLKEHIRGVHDNIRRIRKRAVKSVTSESDSNSE